MKLGIKAEELGRALDAEQIFQGEFVPVTPLIGKLRIHIQEYVDQEDFLISPLRYYDVVLGSLSKLVHGSRSLKSLLFTRVPITILMAP